jgi:hypothetical protein
MKVLEEIKPFENWTLKVECNGLKWNQNNKVPCGSLLEIDKDDVIKREWSKYPDYSGINYGFICPICGCFTELNEKDLPEGMEDYAKNYLDVTNSIPNRSSVLIRKEQVWNT